ncbi:MAG: hypothetical protein WAP23_02820 [Candidatus Spechtbacterales bacterium]
MAYEVGDWKTPGCSLSIKTDNLSTREEHSSEINETFGEGGALNANYRTLESAMVAANILGEQLGMRYGVHFVFKTSGFDTIHLDFCDEASRNAAEKVIRQIDKILS